MNKILPSYSFKWLKNLYWKQIPFLFILRKCVHIEMLYIFSVVFKIGGVEGKRDVTGLADGRSGFRRSSITLKMSDLGPQIS